MIALGSGYAEPSGSADDETVNKEAVRTALRWRKSR